MRRAAAPPPAPHPCAAPAGGRRRRQRPPPPAASPSPAPEVERYAARGVSAGKEDVHAAIARSDKGVFPTAFCKARPHHTQPPAAPPPPPSASPAPQVVSDVAGDPEWCTVVHADGAGTKASLAYCYWRATGDASVWSGVATDAVVMNTDDLLCVGALGRPSAPVLLSSTIGRNKALVPGAVLSALVEGTEAALGRLRGCGFHAVSAGGETADLGDLVRTVVVDSTVVARMRRDEVLDAGRVQAGDVVVGWASDGQASYEGGYNSGIGSNGLTLARHEVLGRDVAAAYPESFDGALAAAGVAYTGPHRLLDVEPETGLAVAALLLSPTRTYAPCVAALLAGRPPGSAARSALHALVHCSGGGQTKVLHFLPPSGLHVIKDGLFPVPPVFRLVQRCGATPWREMYRVFNCGHRFEVYVPPGEAAAVVEAAERFGVAAKIVGRVAACDGPSRVTVSSPHGDFTYVKGE